MNTQELVQMAVQILLVPIMGAVATFVVTYLRAKSEQIRRKIDDDTINKYIYLAEDIIATAVLQVNQVFVEELNKDGS